MTRMIRPLIALAALALTAPASASAATVAVVDGKPTFTAASGEANRLTVSVVTGGVRFEDDGISSITAGSGCTAPAGKRVDCLVPVVPGVVVDVGDGTDEAYVNVLSPATVYGGLGNDTLRGGAGNDTIDGGPGNDTIDALWGDDVLVGAEGADSLTGSFGRDRVSYADRSTAVSVTLDDVANDGQSGEADNVRASVEHVTGGAGNDSVTGDDDSNELTGGAGDDTLDGGPGTDGFSGGAGVDNLKARDGVQESLACGSEGDIAEADYNDTAAADCEVVNRDQAPPVPEVPPVVRPELPPPPTGGTGNVVEPPVVTIPSAPINVSDGGVAAVRVNCPREAFSGCEGSIDIEELAAAGTNAQAPLVPARRRKLASKRFKLAAGKSATIPVRMDRRSWRSFKKKLRKRRKIKVQISVTMENATGTTTNTRIVTLRRQPAKKKKKRRSRR
jgi:hypothetical protein